MLARMADKAREMGIVGTAVAAWYDPRTGLVSHACGCGKMFAPDVNLLAIAGSKIAEMCDTGRPSGSGVRPPPTGEFAYHGGTLKQVGTGCFLAAFSGASGADDLIVAQWGLDGV
jgi:hypothetical protein